MPTVLGQGPQAKKDRKILPIMLQAPLKEVFFPAHAILKHSLQGSLTACCLQGCLPGYWQSH